MAVFISSFETDSRPDAPLGAWEPDARLDQSSKPSLDLMSYHHRRKLQ